MHRNISDPGAVVAALRTPGRSPGATARLVDEFFARTGLGTHLDEASSRAVQRRARRLNRVPVTLRPAVEAFAEHLLHSRTRAALIGTSALADSTIDARIAGLAQLAEELDHRGIADWSAVASSDIETFVTFSPSARLASCRAFFAFAKRRRLILVDPTSGITRMSPRGFAGRVLNTDQQRQLMRRWMRTDLDPRERAVGLLSLIHAASGSELRHLQSTDIELATGTLTLGRRPHRLPLDPLSASALDDLIQGREAMKTSNPHAIVTKVTRAHLTPCSPHFMTHVLDRANVVPSLLRQTRLADMAHQLDPRLVSAAFGITEGAALHYVTDAVHDEEQSLRPHL